MVTQARIYQGSWRKLANLAANSIGSIHDDDYARSKGFQRGFVWGGTVAEAAMPAIIDRFGQPWVEGGWFHIKFIGPVYEDEDVREVSEPIDDSDAIRIVVETREGRVTSVGEAGLGIALPWNVGEDGTRGGTEAFPRLTLGQALPDITINVTEKEVLRDCDIAGNLIPWFRNTSPWGGAVVPAPMVSGLHRPAEWGQDDHVEPAGIYAEFWMVSKRPVFQGQPYAASTKLVDKGTAGRTWFLTVEFEVRNMAGTPVFAGRRKTKFFLKRR